MLETSPQTMKKWFLLYTKPRQEAIAIANLQQQNYLTFAPRVLVNTVKRQKPHTEWQFLFPNYVFVQLSREADNWSSVKYTRGVRGFVRFGDGLPASLDDAVIAQLAALDHQQAAQQLSPLAKVGESVHLAVGETWVEALVTATDAAGRLQVLFSLLGQPQSLWVDATLLA